MTRVWYRGQKDSSSICDPYFCIQEPRGLNSRHYTQAQGVKVLCAMLDSTNAPLVGERNRSII
jgi:hypothetical protein